MSPLLAYTSDNNEHSLRDAAENLAVHFKLTPEERQELLPSGTPLFLITG
ncbi:MAG: winged helix-turn-helix domain-containing protein [Lentimicrobiaceae bacterium]|jgi:restriction system protein